VFSPAEEPFSTVLPKCVPRLLPPCFGLRHDGAEAGVTPHRIEGRSDGECRGNEVALVDRALQPAHAGRKPPEFFPARPLEEIYDPGSARWRDLVHRRKQATLRRERDRLTIEFADDLQHHEITPYLGLLPQTLKYEKSGRKLIVENPAEFEQWLGDDRPSVLDRVRGVFRRT
jgi:hypothetical protein